MDIHALTSSLPLHDAASLRDPADRAGHGAGGFAASLSTALQADDSDEQAVRRQQVREAAEQFVASAFLMPIFKELRDSPFKSEMFHGGPGEDAFGQQLDMQMADRMASRMNLPLVDVIERQFLGERRTLGTRLNTHG